MDIPKAICAWCSSEMQFRACNLICEVRSTGSYRCKVYVDKYECTICGSVVALPTGKALAETGSRNYQRFPAVFHVKLL